MSTKDHKPTQWGNETRCIWDHDPWPCDTVKLVAEVRRDVAAEVRSKNPEPVCCNLHAATWQASMDIAEEIEDKAEEILKGIEAPND